MAESTTGVMAGVKLVLLGSELNAGFLKDDSGTRVYLLQEVDAVNDGVTVKQLIQDVKSLLNKQPSDTVEGLDEDSITKQLTAASSPKPSFNIDSVRIKLRTVYLNIFTPTSGSTNYEYAFKVDVYCEDLVPKTVQLIQVKQLTLAIWKTDNPTVKKLLAIPESSGK